MVKLQAFMGSTHLLLFINLFPLAYGGNIKLNDNYFLHYFLYDNGRRIQFEVETINVYGWVGIGVNELGPDIPGVDIYIGGYYGISGRPYGLDMHIPIDTIDKFPVQDLERNWDLGSSNEDNCTTYLTVRRPLISSDKANDTDIMNKTIHLICAYNQNNDLPLDYGPTEWGSECVNLITDSVGCATTEITTATKGTTTEGPSMAVRFTGGRMCFILIIIMKWLF